MNATETVKQGAGASEPRAYEPSMEEILASIRRIIADDQSLPARAARESEATRDAQPKPDAPAPAAPADPSRQERGPFLRGAADGASVVYRHPAAQGDSAAEAAAKAEPQAPRIVAGAGPIGHIAAPQFAMPDLPAPRTPPARAADEDTEAALLRFTAPPQAPAADRKSGDTAEARPEATSSLFSVETDKSVTAAFNRLAASRLIENDDELRSLTREMLRPLLKTWLDENLPGMVERMVRAEIERVARGGH
jgi:cell pole-organizing protein PopZ